MRTTYPNESFNSHIWRRAPKHLPLWKPTVDIVVEMAVLEFNKGSSGFVSVLENFSIVVVVYPLPWPLLVGGVRCSRLWSTSQLLRPSGQQCSHSGGVCPQIQGRQCGAYVGAVEEMMCAVCVDVTEGA